ncbi:MAG: hypothetical protein IT379_35760 [Deltaproteobacteria bacterium]|nr:hypothetical protein [Deltaproteobacteria bacterium]
MRTWAILSGVVSALAGLTVPSARAEDFDPNGRAWNASGDLAAIARQEGIALARPVERFDLSALRADDGLLLLAPEPEVPAGGLQAFLRAGGRVAIAADYQRGGTTILDWFRIELGRVPTDGVERERQNPHLAVAIPRSAHALCAGVDGIVTNHARTVRHPRLRPVLGFTRTGDDALVLTGRVGEGRLVAVGDPSVLINNMLRFRGNRRFAANLLRYLAGERRGRVVVLAGSIRIVGSYGAAPEPTTLLEALNRALDELSKMPLPPGLTRLVAFLVAFGAIVLFGFLVPRRSPYDGEHLVPVPHAEGGFAGRLGVFERPGANLLYPALVYKSVLEADVLRLLGAPGPLALRDVLERLRARRVPAGEVARFRELLLELDRLAREQDRPPAPPQVHPADFRAIVARGEAVVSRLKSNALEPRPLEGGPHTDGRAA